MRLGKYTHTITASFIGIFLQAVVCGFVPLLFLIFNREYDVSLTQLTLLSTMNFVAQFATDGLSVFFVDKLGYRPAAILAHLLSAFGFVFMGIVAPKMAEPYLWILLAVIIFSVGGGLMEVILSPIVEACPTKNKSATLSLLHSMFGIGSVVVILSTTAALAIFGWQCWTVISVIWGFISLGNALYFFFVPIYDRTRQKEKMSISGLLRSKPFWGFMLIMACGGASEIGMSQWASAFAESSLGISKTVGDILGPCVLAVMMAASRILYSKVAGRIDLTKCVIWCGIFGAVCYLGAALIPVNIVALIFCGLCGFAVGILWPGSLSLAAKAYPAAGASMFALMALAGDLGCTLGPTVIGFVSSFFGGNLRTGLLAATMFPAILVVGLLAMKKKDR